MHKDRSIVPRLSVYSHIVSLICKWVCSFYNSTRSLCPGIAQLFLRVGQYNMFIRHPQQPTRPAKCPTLTAQRKQHYYIDHENRQP